MMKKLSIAFLLLIQISFVMVSCNNEYELDNTEYVCPMKCEGDKTYSKEGSCPVCKMDLVSTADLTREESTENEVLETSIFNLSSKWNTKDNRSIELKDLKGDVLIVTMIYTSCKAACPRLVADMRSINEKVNNPAIKYVLVSIDPETDTPDRFNEFAKENGIDNDQWIFLQGTLDDVRELSNVLAVKYKKISPIDFSHSNIISVFDKDGVMYYQQEGLGVVNQEIITKIKSLVD